MRLLLILWIFPLAFFWGWYGLSYYDFNFGVNFFSRRTHDVVFALYGKILGMPANEVPLALVKIFAFDSLFVLAMAAWRWRKSWYPQTKQWAIGKYQAFRGGEKAIENQNGFNPEIANGPAHPAE